MNEKKYGKQLFKIYVSFLFCPLWFLILLVLARIFPGTFQEQSIIGKISIILLIVFGIAYIIFLIKFLSRKENIECMEYYQKIKHKANKK